MTLRHIDCARTRIALFLGLLLGGAGLAHADTEAGDDAGTARSGPALRVDQPAISGLWGTPELAGQGLSIDWLPGTRTLSATWLTFAAEGGSTAAGQRWYTLQTGAVTAGVTLLDLPILKSTGGNFDALPAVSPVQVGRATLAFGDCNSATVLYQFDASENGGAAGELKLQRLTPATQDCVQANGSVLPGADARPPREGFDARLSGRWSESANSGQGLQFHVQPGGVFFASWSTFDPAGAGDDAARQHWFTLQGPLANAVRGGVDLQIVQATGGSLDGAAGGVPLIVGVAELRLIGCDRARLDYRFRNDRERAGAYAARRGTLLLSKDGGCAAP